MSARTKGRGPPPTLLEVLDKADRLFDNEMAAIRYALDNKRPGQKAYAARGDGKRSCVMILGKGRPQFINCVWGFHFDRAKVHADAFNRKVPNVATKATGVFEL